MKLTLILSACTILSLATQSKADFKQDLKNRLTQAQLYVQKNPAQLAKITAGGISLAAGIFLDLIIIDDLPKTKSYSASAALCFASSCIVYSGYDTINNALNNKPNDALKGLFQEARVQLSRLKVNEQK